MYQKAYLEDDQVCFLYEGKVTKLALYKNCQNTVRICDPFTILWQFYLNKLIPIKPLPLTLSGIGDENNDNKIQQNAYFNGLSSSSDCFVVWKQSHKKKKFVSDDGITLYLTDFGPQVDISWESNKDITISFYTAYDNLEFRAYPVFDTDKNVIATYSGRTGKFTTRNTNFLCAMVDKEAQIKLHVRTSKCKEQYGSVCKYNNVQYGSDCKYNNEQYGFDDKYNNEQYGFDDKYSDQYGSDGKYSEQFRPDCKYKEQCGSGCKYNEHCGLDHKYLRFCYKDCKYKLSIQKSYCKLQQLEDNIMCTLKVLSKEWPCDNVIPKLFSKEFLGVWDILSYVGTWGYMGPSIIKQFNLPPSSETRLRGISFLTDPSSIVRVFSFDIENTDGPIVNNDDEFPFPFLLDTFSDALIYRIIWKISDAAISDNIKIGFYTSDAFDPNITNRLWLVCGNKGPSLFDANKCNNYMGSFICKYLSRLYIAADRDVTIQLRIQIIVPEKKVFPLFFEDKYVYEYYKTQNGLIPVTKSILLLDTGTTDIEGDTDIVTDPSTDITLETTTPLPCFREASEYVDKYINDTSLSITLFDPSEPTSGIMAKQFLSRTASVSLEPKAEWGAKAVETVVYNENEMIPTSSSVSNRDYNYFAYIRINPPDKRKRSVHYFRQGNTGIAIQRSRIAPNVGDVNVRVDLTIYIEFASARTYDNDVIHFSLSLQDLNSSSWSTHKQANGTKAQSFVDVLRPSQDGSVQQSFTRDFVFGTNVKGFTPNVFIRRIGGIRLRFDPDTTSVQFTNIRLQYITN